MQVYRENLSPWWHMPEHRSARMQRDLSRISGEEKPDHCTGNMEASKKGNLNIKLLKRYNHA